MTNALRPFGLGGFLLAALLCAACGGGGGSGGGGGLPPSGGGGGIPTPTPSPVRPTPTPQPSVAMQALVPGVANTFPLNDGFGGSVIFPAGTKPASGATIALSTTLQSPANYATFIPSGFAGQGANATAPWLTFTLSEQVQAPGALAVQFRLPSVCQSGQYFVALFDVTASPKAPIDSRAISCSGGLVRGNVAARMRRPFGAARSLRDRPNVEGAVTLPGQHVFYLGLFFAPGAPTPSPTPTNVPSPKTIHKPLQAGGAISFPTVDGQGGSLTFPSGSSPIAGNTITLTTALSQPAGYPSSIPPGWIGVGATAVTPWLTYSLSETLNTPPSSNIIVQFLFGTQPPPGNYFLGVFDITRDPTEPLGTAPIVINPSIRTHGQARIPVSLLRGRRHRGAQPDDTIPANDLIYLGLFFEPGGSQENTEPVSAAGGSFTVPAFNGFTGSVAYPPNDAPSGSTMTLVGATSDFTGGLAPPPPQGLPIFYLGLQLSSLTQQIVIFHAHGTTGTIASKSLMNGAAYSLYGYDITTSNPNPFYQAGPILAHAGAVTFTSPLDGQSVTNLDQLVVELVQD